MNIIIKGIHMEITPAIEEYVRKKAQGLEKFLDINSKLEVDLGKTTRHHKSNDAFKAEYKVFSPSGYSQSAVEAENLYSAIDLARDEIFMVLSSKKDKKMTLWKKGGHKIKNLIRGMNFRKKGVIDAE